jgi:UDP-N-acetylglucosamine transferase subunit ALG13
MSSPPKTFVSLGNATQSFYRLLDYLDGVYELLPKPILVQNGNTFFDKSGYSIQKFLSPKEYTDAIDSAEILIFHAGAGSVINALKVHKKPIIVPRLGWIREHINDHQLNFAIAMSQTGAVYLAQSQIELKEAVSRVLSSKSNNLQQNHQNIQELVAQVFDKYSVK